MQEAALQVATAKLPALQPFAPAAPQPAVGGAGGPLREIFGFALASSLSDPTFGYPSWDFSLLSTVAFFGVHIMDNGGFANDSGWAVWNSSQISGLVSAAHSRGTKVVLTIILQDFAANTPNMCAGLKNFTTTVNNTVAEVKAKGVDGVNVDYEGLNGSCGTADSSYARHAFSNFMGSLRSAMPAGSYLSVDTYASSATDTVGFFDVPALGGSVDSFFVMAYDLEYSNYSRPPTNCSSFCLGPTAPLGGYYYNDTSTAQQYMNTVPASKVILGVPYYGRKACVASATPNQYPTNPPAVADTYLDAVGEATAPGVQPGSYATHRDANDPAGQERWDTWFNTTMNCTRELYWDDTTSLGLKYDLVNRDNLRGVGIWNLNYGGGAAELWASLNTHFACQVAINVPASPATTEFTLGLTAGSCSVSYYELQQFDSTNNQGWFGLPQVTPSGGTANAVVEGYPGHTYQFQARAHSSSGLVGPWGSASTTVASTATYSHAFKGMYTLDAFGGISADASPPLGTTSYWSGWAIARAARPWPGASPQAGFVLDGFGGLSRYGAPAVTETAGAAGHYWGFDIARDVAFTPDGFGGFVLDGYGGLHPFKVNNHTEPLAAQGNSYWGGWDIARKVVIFPDGTGGYVMDAFGGLHPFGINRASPVGPIAGTAYWPNWAIAKDVVLVPGNANHSGYVLDGYGGLHPFHPTGDGSAMPGAITAPYWGWDIARAAFFLPGSATAGYVLDGYGGLNSFGGATAVTMRPYWAGWDVARGVAGG
jgi:spore germination protein YaaH